MNEPRTLQEYIEMRNLQRKRQNCLVNEAKNFPNALTLDKQKKIDHLMLEIFDYIKHIVGDGPIFHRFRLMMQNLYKTFQRELTEFHNVGLVNKFKTDQRYIEDMKKANLKLNDYLEKCEQEGKSTDEKLEKLQKNNKELNNNMLIINRNSPKKVEIQDHFDDEEVVERTEKVGKTIKIEPEDKNKKSSIALLPLSKKVDTVKQVNSRTSKATTKQPQKQTKDQKTISKIPNFFAQI